jgi:putative ABC transport system permease protein
MNRTELDRLAGEGPRIDGARVELDSSGIDRLYAAVKATPAIGAVSLLTKSRENFRNSFAQNIYIETFVYAGLAAIVTFGVIYNAARIQLSERARELASLRVLGFTKGEVFRVLLVELAVVLLIAQPLGWALGYGFCWLVVQGFVTDLFRIPFVINPSTYAFASGLVLAVGTFSALVVRRRVQRLDLIAVLKTRD